MTQTWLRRRSHYWDFLLRSRIMRCVSVFFKSSFTSTETLENYWDVSFFKNVPKIIVINKLVKFHDVKNSIIGVTILKKPRPYLKFFFEKMTLEALVLENGRVTRTFHISSRFSCSSFNHSFYSFLKFHRRKFRLKIPFKGRGRGRVVS